MAAAVGINGGTRPAAITGSWVALRIAMNGLLAGGKLKKDPLNGSVAAISCGIVRGHPVLDLDYEEDSSAETDANFVMTGDGAVIEIQATAEANPFSRHQLNEMLDLNYLNLLLQIYHMYFFFQNRIISHMHAIYF